VEYSQYLSDIQTQPRALLSALPRFDPRSLETLAYRLRCGDFERIVVTGMGASLFAAYPAWLLLAQAGLPAVWVDASELTHYAGSLVTSHSLLWIFSQSGRSAEVMGLLEQASASPPAAMLAVTNDLESPLAQGATTTIPLHAAPEQTVSTRTYLHSLAFGQLAALILTGRETAQHLADLAKTAQAIESYLEDWERQLNHIAETIGHPERLVLLGRGPSLAAAYNGALILGEAAKLHSSGMPAGHFRHGPLEMAGPDLTVLILAGDARTVHLNRKLYDELRRYEVRCFWISTDDQADLSMPAAHGIGLPLAEIIPLQLLSVGLCLAQGITPGELFHIGKVTLEE
jgi:glucosamine--fructose-6-phosphate aminotransferase (isomerizing)